MRRSIYHLLAVTLFLCTIAQAQPTKVSEGVKFVYPGGSASTVSLVGDFNSWSDEVHPMAKSGEEWSVTVDLLPGTYQYAFLVDKDRIVIDPNNSITFESIDGRRLNSLLTLSSEGNIVTEGYPVRKRLDDDYSNSGGTVFLNLVFKHHLPMYYDVNTDNIAAPFVRQHATRDYFELADVIQRYPNVHATVVLSPTLLWQIQEIYVKRMEPYIKKYRAMNPKDADIDAGRFLAAEKGKTDPWIDICLTPAEQLTAEDKAHLYENEWNAFTMSPVRLNRFPELHALYEKYRDSDGKPNYTVDELRLLKFFAIFANFDAEFYERRVPLIQTGTRIYRSLDLRDLVSFRSDGKYYLKREITEDDCRRAVASAWYIMASILPAFDKAQYNARAMIGQLELAASSYSDAVLPLLIDSDIAKRTSPGITLPPAYKHPEDADAQLKMGLEMYKRYFNGLTPSGYVPPYGAMSPEVIPVLKDNGFEWFISAEEVLRSSEPRNLPSTFPYSVTVDGKTMYGTFANSVLTNRINWVYRNFYAENSADDLLTNVLSLAPNNEKKHTLVTVVIDNDEAWMHYERDIDGKGIINGLYRKLNKLFDTREVVSVTMSEYIHGNRLRGVPPHRPADYTEIKTLGTGSRFNGKLDLWIGTEETNAAWKLLAATRKDIGGASEPVTSAEYLEGSSLAFPLFYAATSPNWMQAFNRNSIASANPEPFQEVFLAHLGNAYAKAGLTAPATMKPFAKAEQFKQDWQAPRKRTQVTFICRLVDREAITSVFVAGSRKELRNMEPNTVRMWDNGENGDKTYGDNAWTLVVEIDEGELVYKYTNSGGQGTWDGSEAFPDQWRKVMITGDKMTIEDIFARIKKRP